MDRHIAKVVRHSGGIIDEPWQEAFHESRIVVLSVRVAGLFCFESQCVDGVLLRGVPDRQSNDRPLRRSDGDPTQTGRNSPHCMRPDRIEILIAGRRCTSFKFRILGSRLCD